MPTLRSFRWTHLPFVVLACLATSIAACSAASSDAASCEAVCNAVPDCEGASCMAQCGALESACTEEGARSAFAEWVGCRPTLACMGGAFVPVTCRPESSAISACGATAITLGLGGGTASDASGHRCTRSDLDASGACRD